MILFKASSIVKTSTLALLGGLGIAACASSGNYAPVVYHQYGNAGDAVAQDTVAQNDSSDRIFGPSGDPSMHAAGVGKVQSEPLGITGATLPAPAPDAAPSSSGPIEAEQPHSIVPQPIQQSADIAAPLPPVQVAPQPPKQPKPEEPPLVTAQDFAPTGPSAPQTIIVKPGVTLFSVGRNYHVSRQAIIDANNLKAPFALKIGSKLIIPGETSQANATPPVEAAQAPAPIAAPVKEVASTPAPQVASSAPVSASSSITSETSTPSPSPPPASAKTHIVKRGETIASIARNEHMRFTELIEINKIAKPYHVKVGEQLKLSPPVLVEVAKKNDDAAKEVEVAEAKPESKPVKQHTDAPAEGGPLLHLGESPIAPASAPRMEPEQQANIAAPSKHEFIWPVTGRILSAFGPKEAGRRNDGVNIAAPLGTAVRAARAGEVIYVGNELRGYGNLVLIRHDDGFVSAYAHNSRVLVTRGAFVQQGQEIAESGQSGSVDAPQVHFEIRKDRKPIDPLGYLPKA